MKRVQGEMAKRGIDVLMVNHLENIYYLSATGRSSTTPSWRCSCRHRDPIHLSRFIEKSVLQGRLGRRPDLLSRHEAYIDAATRVILERKWDNVAIGVDKSAGT